MKAINLVMEIPGATQEQYDAIMADLHMDTDIPKGLIFHSAGPMEGGWRVSDVWESQADFEAFFGSRLGAAVQKAQLPQFTPKSYEVYGYEKA